MIAPACPMRLPGGAVWPAMKPTTGLPKRLPAHSAASCSAVPPISPIITTALVSGSSAKAAKQSTKLVPINGVASDANTASLTVTGLA